ncbi:MAG: autotransporter outer membrane beta-barrel domain-containing protein [Candidatus Rickettsia vulgarisii]
MSSILVRTNKPYVLYLLKISNGDIHLYRQDDAESQAIADIRLAGGDDFDVENVSLLTQIGERSVLWDSLGDFTDSEERGKLLRYIVNNADPQINEILAHVMNNFGDQVNNRMLSQNVPLAPVASCDNDISGKKYGVWFSPYYSRSSQGMLGGLEGYSTRSQGGIIGADTTVNDDLTTIGLAVARTRTDVKLKDYMLGVKSKVKDWIFSIYGLQQLKDQWFVQGAAMYSTARV